MLLKIREIVSGWLAAVIVVLLIIPFAFWGINYYFGSGGNVLAVEVNDSGITLQEFQRAYQNTRQRWQSIMGGSISVDQEPVLKQNTVDALIERELIRQINDGLKLRIGDVQLTNIIKSIPEFQGVNGFDTFMYEQSLSRMGFNSAGFEAQMRNDMASIQLQAALLQSIFITRKELDEIASLINQKRDLSYAILSSNEVKESIVVTDQEVDSYYTELGREFMDPEQVKIAYVDLSLRRMAAAVQIDEEDLREYYENNRAQYEVEDQRKFKHLFMAADPEAGTEKVAAVREEMEALHERITSGMSFEDAVAAGNSETTADIEIIDQEFITKGIMEPELDNVLFALNTGELSNPIQTESGLHIIRLEEIMGGVTSTFEEAREQVEEEYRLDQAEPEFADALDHMTNLAFEHPDSLTVIAEDLGLTIYESDFFDRQWQPNELLRNTSIVNACFSDDVLLAGNNSEPIEVEENRYIVLRVVEHKPEKKKPLDEVRDRIITRIKFERGRDETRGKGEAVINELRNTDAADEIARKHDLIWQRVSGIKRDGPEVDGAILRSAFRLGRPQSGQRVYGGTSLSSGDYAIIVVEAVIDGGPDDLNSEELTTLKSQLERMSASDIWIQLLNDLKAKADIRVYSDNL